MAKSASKAAGKDAISALSKKSKTLQKKASKKSYSTAQSPEAKKVSLILKNEKKNKGVKKNSAKQASPNLQSPEMEIKLKLKSKVKKSEGKKKSRFDEMQKIHKELKEKKKRKAQRDEEDEDSDESADEDDAACKSYAQDFGMDDSMDASEGESDEEEEEEEKVEVVKPSQKEAKSNKSKKKEYTDIMDPVEQACTILLTNVNVKTSRDKITAAFRKYGKVVSVRFRNMPVTHEAKGTVRDKVRNKLFKKEATSMFAFIKYSTAEEATAALHANTLELDGHHIFVEPSLSKSAVDKRRLLTEGRQIVLGNLPFAIEAEPLYREFKSCGDIVGINIPKKFGRSIGVAFIEFKDKSGVEIALQKEGVKISGRDVRISKAVRKVKQTGSPADLKKSFKNASPRDKKQGPKKRVNKDELKKKAIARKLARK